MSLSRLIRPGDLSRGDGRSLLRSSDVFESRRKSKLTYVGRLRGYRDLTEGTNIDIGGSYAVGPSTEAPDLFTLEDPTRSCSASSDVQVSATPARHLQALPGEDRTGLERPPVARQHRRARLRLPAARISVRAPLVRRRPLRSLGASARSIARRHGGSFYLTFWPSEFNQIRGQYRRTNYGDGVTANEFLFQLNFSIGAHGAHVF